MRNLGRLSNSRIREALEAMAARAVADGLIPTADVDATTLARAVPRTYARNCVEAAALLDDDYRARPARGPCPWPPGSPGKVATLAARVEAGEELFHPDDLSDYAA